VNNLFSDVHLKFAPDSSQSMQFIFTYTCTWVLFLLLEPINARIQLTIM